MAEAVVSGIPASTSKPWNPPAPSRPCPAPPPRDHPSPPSSPVTSHTPTAIFSRPQPPIPTENRSKTPPPALPPRGGSRSRSSTVPSTAMVEENNSASFLTKSPPPPLPIRDRPCPSPPSATKIPIQNRPCPSPPGSSPSGNPPPFSPTLSKSPPPSRTPPRCEASFAPLPPSSSKPRKNESTRPSQASHLTSPPTHFRPPPGISPSHSSTGSTSSVYTGSTSSFSSSTGSVISHPSPSSSPYPALSSSPVDFGTPNSPSNYPHGFPSESISDFSPRHSSFCSSSPPTSPGSPVKAAYSLNILPSSPSHTLQGLRIGSREDLRRQQEEKIKEGTQEGQSNHSHHQHHHHHRHRRTQQQQQPRKHQHLYHELNRQASKDKEIEASPGGGKEEGSGKSGSRLVFPKKTPGSTIGKRRHSTPNPPPYNPSSSSSSSSPSVTQPPNIPDFSATHSLTTTPPFPSPPGMGQAKFDFVGPGIGEEWMAKEEKEKKHKGKDGKDGGEKGKDGGEKGKDGGEKGEREGEVTLAGKKKRRIAGLDWEGAPEATKQGGKKVGAGERRGSIPTAIPAKFIGTTKGLTFKIKNNNKKTDTFVISDPSSFQKRNNTPTTLTEGSVEGGEDDESELSLREESGDLGVSFGGVEEGRGGGGGGEEALLEALRLGGRRDMLVSRGESVFDVSGGVRKPKDGGARIKKTFPEEEGRKKKKEKENDKEKDKDKEKVKDKDKEIDKEKQMKTAMAKKALAEIVSTEKSFVLDLVLLVTHYQQPTLSNRFLPREVADEIFLNTGTLLELHTKIVKEFGEEPDLMSVMTAYETACPRLVKEYGIFSGGYQNAVKLLDGNMNKEFTTFCERSRKNPANNGLSLGDFLIKPIQRLCKYPLLFRELNKYLSSSHPAYQACSSVEEKLMDVTLQVDKHQ